MARIKPGRKAIRIYYETLERLTAEGVRHEGAIRTAFHNLVSATAPRGWVLIDELGTRVEAGRIYPDGTLRDGNSLPRGHWEAKDTDDALDAEIRKKIAQGYPTTNIVFEDSRTGVLIQSGTEVLRVDLRIPSELCDLLNTYFEYAEPNIATFEAAVEEFKERVPELARGLSTKIAEAHASNRDFESAFGQFFEVCRSSLNPNLRREAVDEMLVQHLLTERLFRTIFDNDEFTRRNVIAVEVEKVIDALVSHSFNKAEYLRTLNRFYLAIEDAARGLDSFSDKQFFLNTVYERFFQGYSVKVADTHGIVYTPQPIVDFMCASVDHLLREDFGRSLGAQGVNILDPATGTGNFIVNLLRRIAGPDLGRAYREQLFANEVMLLPYYIAAMNIEHAYLDLTNTYESFEGICFVDTLDLAETNATMNLFTETNTERVKSERETPITVIIGNPPYNVGQINENDNNKNRKYDVVDRRIKDTYAKASTATLNTKLYDPYVKFFRWATDRLEGRDGIVCFVTNDSFLDQIAFDGMRKHLASDFTRIYHLNLGGNIRENPELSGTTHNVFQIQVGVGITIAERLASDSEVRLFHSSLPGDWTRNQKLEWLADHPSLEDVDWREIHADSAGNWLVDVAAEQFSSYIPVGTKATKAATVTATADVDALFKTYSLGVSTNRDATVYGFHRSELEPKVREFIEQYTAEMGRYEAAGRPNDLDSFVDGTKIQWSETLKRSLRRGSKVVFDTQSMISSEYRPFTTKVLYYAPVAVDRPGNWRNFSTSADSGDENRAICVPTISSRGNWTPFMVSNVPNLNLTSIDAFQCFPLYTYDDEGGNRRANITEFGVQRFSDSAIITEVKKSRRTQSSTTCTDCFTTPDTSKGSR